MSNAQVKEFWDGMAAQHKSSDLATAPDHYYRELEINSILDAINDVPNRRILDVGCGNGFTTRKIAEAFPHADIIGIDYSMPMIVEANKLQLNNAKFYVGDVLALTEHSMLEHEAYDVVLSSRCLINLGNWPDQMHGIKQMNAMLSKPGTLVLVENCKEGLANLNHLRNQFGLEPINTRWHNCYLSREKVFQILNDLNLVPGYVENIGNLYYVCSRVIYAKLCKDQDVEPDYNNPINAIASKLPTMGEHYDCSPNYMFVYKSYKNG